MSKPNGLDPKRAQNFNRATVEDYFGRRRKLEKDFDGIPPEHQWNIDEKGIQLDASCKK